MNNLFSGLALLQAGGTGGNATGSMVSTLVTFGLVFVIFYFLIIRPQNKKQKETKRMIEAVKKGDKVITAGGLHAVVYAVKDTTIVLKVDETKMEFSKSAISAVVDPKAEEKIEAKADAKADAKVEAEKPAEPKAEPKAEDKK
jgi:preprotein translocase subunit YajC